MNKDKGVRVIGGIVFALVALLSGSCSLFFAYLEYFEFPLGAEPIWGFGLIIAAICAYGAFKMFFGRTPSPEDAAESQSNSNTPGPPPDA